MSEPPTPSGAPTPRQPSRHDPGSRPGVGCGTVLLMLLGVVLLVPGVCAIFLVQRPGGWFGPGASLIWSLLAISAGGVGLIALAIRETMRR